MKMFGVIQYKGDENSDDDYIKAGYEQILDNNGEIEKYNAKRIISYDSSLSNCLGDGIQSQLKDKMDIPKRQLFIDNFRKIASTSVGRVLLYRILIEIRRKDKDEKGEIGEDVDGLLAKDLQLRNKCRSIIISFGNFGFSGSEQSIYFKSDDIDAAVIDEGTHTLKQDDENNLHIHLFHEMCHWYYHLRDYLKKSDETFGKKYQILTRKLCKFFWRDTWKFKAKLKEKESPITNEGMFWFVDSNVSFDDIRNVLGSFAYICNCSIKDSCCINEDYINGDDLCENLYRRCVGYNLRFTHLAINYCLIKTYEPDKNVLKNVIDCCNKNFDRYR